MPFSFVYLNRNEKNVQMESEMISRCQSGDKAAFRWVVQTYQRMLFSLALKMLADEEEAKDIVQETFISVWKNFKNYDSRKPFTTWLYTISSRLCLNRLKAKKITACQPDDITVFRQFASEEDSQRTLENSEWISIVKTLAEGLSKKQRLVFTLGQLEGLSAMEIEQITGLDTKQVKSNMYVARQTIRKRLKDLGYE